MNEIEKLQARLYDDKTKTHAFLSVTWGPEAHLLTPEERARHLNECMDRVAAGDYEPWEVRDSVGLRPTSRSS